MTLDEIARDISEIRQDLFRSHPPQVMTPVEAAAFLGVTVETMFLWRKNGTGPRFSQPTPRFLRYLHDDLVAWMKEHQ